MSKATPGAGSIRDIEQKKKEVFKPLLENPFSKGAEWPMVERPAADTIMDYLTQMLSGYGSYLELKNSKKDNVPIPEISTKITIGFNSTVRKLEDQAKPNRDRLLGKATSAKEGKSKHKSEADAPRNTDKYVKYVFVAKSDISTPLLTSTFPLLTYTASTSAQNRVKLIELPRGAMHRLLRVLKTDNVSIISLESGWTDGRMLFDFIDENVTDVEVPWLAGLFRDGNMAVSEYLPPNIKFVKTTIPLGRVDKGKKKGPLLRKKKNRKGEAKAKEGDSK